MAPRAAGFCEYAGGLRRGVRLSGNRSDVRTCLQHLAREGDGSGRWEGQNRARGFGKDVLVRETARLQRLLLDGMGQPGGSLRGDGGADSKNVEESLLMARWQS